MKKLIVGLAAAVLLPAALFAVDLSYGAKAGAGAAMLTGSDWTDMLDGTGDNNSLTLSVSAAAFLNIGLSDSLSIQPEAGYTMLGGKGSKDDRTYVRYTFNVLEVPVFLMPKFAAGPGTLVAFAGPDLFLALGNLRWVEIVDGEKYDEGSVDPNNPLLLGFALGAGYLLPMGPGSLVVDARYSHVLTKMFDDLKWYTGGLNVRVGYSMKPNAGP